MFKKPWLEKIDIEVLPVISGLIALLIYLATWQMNFGGYEMETAEASLKLLSGEYAVKRAGISAVLLYLPFSLFFKILNLSNIGWLSIVPLFYSAITIIVLGCITTYFTKKKIIIFSLPLAIAFGSIIWPYTNIGMEYQAGFYLSLLLLSLLYWQKENKKLILVGFSFALLATAKSYGAMFGLPALLFMYFSQEKKYKKDYKNLLTDFTWVLVPAGLAFLADKLIQWKIYGSLSGVYSLGHEFQIWTWWEGFYGISFSVGKGIFFFSPLLIITLFYWQRFYRENKSTSIFILTSFILLLLITAPFSYWADETWGPRKLVPIISLLHLPLIYVLDKKFSWQNVRTYLLGLIFLSAVYIQFLGASYYYGKQLNILRDGNLDSLHHMRFTPELSHIYINHTLFKNYLSTKNKNMTYSEQTWFRWVIGEEDIYLDNANIDISGYSKPDIVWVGK